MLDSKPFEDAGPAGARRTRENPSNPMNRGPLIGFMSDEQRRLHRTPSEEELERMQRKHKTAKLALEETELQAQIAQAQLKQLNANMARKEIAQHDAMARAPTATGGAKAPTATGGASSLQAHHLSLPATPVSPTPNNPMVSSPMSAATTLGGVNSPISEASSLVLADLRARTTALAALRSQRMVVEKNTEAASPEVTAKKEEERQRARAAAREECQKEEERQRTEAVAKEKCQRADGAGNEEDKEKPQGDGTAAKEDDGAGNKEDKEKPQGDETAAKEDQEKRHMAKEAGTDEEGSVTQEWGPAEWADLTEGTKVRIFDWEQSPPCPPCSVEECLCSGLIVGRQLKMVAST